MAFRVVLIPGMGASHVCWKTIRDKTDFKMGVLEYDGTKPFEHILRSAITKMERAWKGETLCLVGHSFGGVLAWHLARQSPQVTRGISVASPWDGWPFAGLLAGAAAAFLGQHFFSNVDRSAPHLREPRSIAVGMPWLNLVATRGFFGGVPNDGVLTVSSQEALCAATGTEQNRLHHSHSEVIHSDEFAAEMNRFLT